MVTERRWSPFSSGHQAADPRTSQTLSVLIDDADNRRHAGILVRRGSGNCLSVSTPPFETGVRASRIHTRVYRLLRLAALVAAIH